MKLSLHNPISPPFGWPKPLGASAFHGLVGRIASTICPRSEIDPAALVLGFLVVFGNEIGLGPHFFVERTRHALNLFVLFVGLSSKGRKGTVQGYINDLFERVIPNWVGSRVQSGLSSGEGIVAAARRLGKDPRLLFVEPEFSGVQRAASRRGSTLYAVIRPGWDGGPFQVATRHDPSRVEGVHLSIIGHTTREDLLENFSRTDIVNGVAGRLLYVCTCRPQLRPFGGNVPEPELQGLSASLAEALQFASGASEIGLSPKAKKLWLQIYPRLSAEVPGKVGAATSRAEAQTRRLAALYALLDGSDIVRSQHLRAALEVWRYCDESARFIFGRSTGEPLVKRILAGLNESPQGLTRTGISEALGRHFESQELDAALCELQGQGLAISKVIKTRGRSAQLWHATIRTHSVTSRKNVVKK